ncbi:MAG: hypothetical protein FJY55_16280 [Betaproteobacteria bacterium]|nr:hypothetical protein [Betaproteobacteria bacterium]
MSEPTPAAEGLDDPDAAAFWRAAARGRLVYSQCTSCSAKWFPLRGVCSACGGDCAERESAGLGEVYTWSRVHRSGESGFSTQVPYVVAMIALDEGFRMMANVEPEGEVAIGRRCHLSFRPSPATGKPAPLFILDEA